MYGKTHTETVKTNMVKNRRNYSGSNNPNARSITIAGIIYNSIKDAMSMLNLSSYKILKIINKND